MYQVLGYKLALQHRELAVHYLTDAEGACANQCSHYERKGRQKAIKGLKGTDIIGYFGGFRTSLCSLKL